MSELVRQSEAFRNYALATSASYRAYTPVSIQEVLHHVRGTAPTAQGSTYGINVT